MYKSTYQQASKKGFWISDSGKAEKQPVDIVRNGIVGLRYADGTERFFPDQKNEFSVPEYDPEYRPSTRGEWRPFMKYWAKDNWGQLMSEKDKTQKYLEMSCLCLGSFNQLEKI